MNKEQWKNVLVSVLVGACVAFVSTLFQGALDFLNAHSEQIISGAVSSAVYLARNMRV